MNMRLTALLMTFLVIVGYCPHTVTIVHNKRGISVLQILFNCLLLRRGSIQLLRVFSQGFRMP